MWYKSENGSIEKPVALDTTSSKVYNYVRKEFELVDPGEDAEPHWVWQETCIPKEDWDLYESIMGHDAALDDVYAALTELAELIVEG